MTSPGIVNVSKFVSAGNKKFAKYVDYVDREKAIRNEHFSEFNANRYDGYHRYMENPEKSSGLFTANKNNLNKEERQKLKESFQLAQKNDSIMWQDVISFDNQFLKEGGIYNPATGYLDETALQASIREGMLATLRNENMEASAVWTASIHYNTDNIHVHIAIVEPYPTREYSTFENKKTGEIYKARRGLRKQNSLDLMKSKVANHLMDRDKELIKVTELVNQRMLPTEERLNEFLTLPMQQLMKSIYQELPEDMRKWKYNMNALDAIRPKIDVLTNMYVNQYHPEDRHELNEALNDQKEFFKRIYGEGTKEANRFEDYKTNKEQEFYAKMGNAFLKECKNIRINEKHAFHQKFGENKIFYSTGLSRRTLKQLKDSLQHDYRSMKNQRKYQELQDEMERK
ncbi:hypothetical protein CRD70_13965 [Listeria monocytogenes]|uniref:Relaxase n=1 Tax=Listeria monocytogenes TaxID=1639 RepID=A0A823J6H3_LISMN|nr:MobP2 family relaxase [Listeria monocytogenes]EAE5923262.1 hypothetical protein [Listeria monocytogenes]EAG6688889.1 hypothetical protein [Listeria monocytogenes]EAG9355025.1 hypothetical protein [Listeria monocytogenes]EHY61376.1 hypothetical protein LMIV_p041 [Listeria monocytogenes FSL J1-208]QOF63856.1 hypothetical protein IFI77_14130 [Listeria monocytogenes FSL J1-208]